MKTVSSKHAAILSITDYPFPGPNPIMSPPPLEGVHKAEISLSLALHPEVSGHSSGISVDDAIILLDWLVYNSRQELVKGFRSPEAFENASGDLDGKCDVARFMTSKAAGELGLEPKRLMTGDLFPGQGTWFPHKFTIVNIPVKEDGKIMEQPYLIDPTYRQFFDPARRAPGSMSEKPPTLPGFVVTRTPEGRALADRLLRDGYAPLDEQNARLYLISFNEDFKPVQGSYLQAMTHPVKQSVGYEEDLAKGRNTSTPLARLEQERLEKISALKNDGERSRWD